MGYVSSVAEVMEAVQGRWEGTFSGSAEVPAFALAVEVSRPGGVEAEPTGVYFDTVLSGDSCTEAQGESELARERPLCAGISVDAEVSLAVAETSNSNPRVILVGRGLPGSATPEGDPREGLVSVGAIGVTLQDHHYGVAPYLDTSAGVILVDVDDDSGGTPLSLVALEPTTHTPLP